MRNATAARAGSAALLALLVLPPPGRAAAPPDADSRVLHALNRLAYGPRPGDAEAVRREGVDAWIERQLHPERIPDQALEERLAALRSGGPARGGAVDARRREIVALQSAKLLRAVYSERQLDEILVDFWMNHFNVFAAKGPVRAMVAAYERDVVRRHAWGRFEDLLRATAESPAMLFYLDNWLSTAPAPPGRPAARRRRGLNENYARELMELHTLGVDGGYTQRDVAEVARCFTGWTLTPPRQADPRFVFRPWRHDRGEKVVLGARIRAGGKADGDEVLRLLARHPATARFVSQKLARRFVADDPPPALVERAAAVFRGTEGDIRQVVRTIVTSPEFFASAVPPAKVKTPLEFVASAARAAGADVRDPRPLAMRVAQMGMPLYLHAPPTGYADTAAAWVSTSALLARLNFATDLAAGRVRGVSLPAARAAAGSATGDGLAERLAAPAFQRR